MQDRTPAGMISALQWSHQMGGALARVRFGLADVSVMIAAP